MRYRRIHVLRKPYPWASMSPEQLRALNKSSSEPPLSESALLRLLRAETRFNAELWGNAMRQRYMR